MLREGLKAAFSPEMFSQDVLLHLAALLTLLLALMLTPTFAFSLPLLGHREDVVQNASFP